jgi:transcriptional regulator with XRE-family HTH domain
MRPRPDEEHRRKEFGRALKALRLARPGTGRAGEMTQPELAKSVDSNQQAVSAWETGRSAPEHPEIVFDLEDFFDVQPGGLAQHLGFGRPLGDPALDAVPTLTQVINATKEIPPAARKTLISIVELQLRGDDL